MPNRDHRPLLVALAIGLAGCTAQVGDGSGDAAGPTAVRDAREERDAARRRMVEMQRREAAARAEANELSAELKLLRAEYDRRLEEVELLRRERDDALADLDDADRELADLGDELDALLDEPWRTPAAWNELRAWMSPDEVVDLLGHPAHVEAAADDEDAVVWFFGAEDDGYVTFAFDDDGAEHVTEIVPPAF